MNKLGTLIRSDWRQIIRDQTLLSFLIFPILLWGMLRWGVPYLTTRYPVLADYHDLMLMFGGMQSAVLFGFVVGFLMVEEKDEQVLDVLRVLPISSLFFLTYRLLFATVVAGTIAFVLLVSSGLAGPGGGASVLLAVLFGLTAPLITLSIATFAKNKIEAMAIFKAIDLVLLLPLLAFFVEGPVRYFFGVVPVFWAYAFLESSVAGAPANWLWMVGLVFYAGALGALSVQFQRRVFHR